MPVVDHVSLGVLTDQQLLDLQLALALACGRSRTSLKRKHRSQLCFHFQLVQLEAFKRGTEQLTPPYHG